MIMCEVPSPGSIPSELIRESGRNRSRELNDEWTESGMSAEFKLSRATPSPDSYAVEANLMKICRRRQKVYGQVNERASEHGTSRIICQL